MHEDLAGTVADFEDVLLVDHPSLDPRHHARSPGQGAQTPIANDQAALILEGHEMRLPASPGEPEPEFSRSYHRLQESDCRAGEQLRISVAITCHLNQSLQIALIRQGSLLDDRSLVLLKELAEQHNLQIWLERVGDGPEVAIVIEDGMVKEVRN